MIYGTRSRVQAGPEVFLRADNLIICQSLSQKVGEDQDLSSEESAGRDGGLRACTCQSSNFRLVMEK